MRVAKIGGRAQSDARLPTLIQRAWSASPGEICLVHGGGDDISAMQRTLGRKAVFVGGRRVTGKADLELLRMVLSGIVNKRLVNSLVAAGVPAVGLSGEDGALIRAELIDVGSLGFAGRPIGINDALLRTLTRAGYMPVISPVGYDATGGIGATEGSGGALNVNGDDAAAAIAAALNAEELLLISDVEGVRDENGETISSLGCDAARELVASGAAGGGMAAKLEAAEAALAAGVARVRVSDIDALGDEARGTFITQSQSVAI